MSWLSQLFGGGSHMPTQNPASSAMPYLNQMQGAYTDPNIFNTIQSQYKESPAFQHKLRRAMEAQGNAAAAGGMAGSLADQRNQAEVANDLSEEDFHKYLAERLGISQDMANILGQKAQYGYGGQLWQNTQNSNDQNKWLSLLGALGGGTLGAIGGGVPGFLFGASQGGSWLK